MLVDAKQPVPDWLGGGHRGGYCLTEVPEVKEKEATAEKKAEDMEIEVKSSQDEATSEDKENEPKPETNKLDTSLAEAANEVLAATNDAVAAMRKELAARKKLVAAKTIPRQKPKSGKFWKEQRGAFR